MNDDVTLSIRQMDGAWRLMCGGGPNPVVAASEGIQYIFSGLPLGFFNLAMLTESKLSADVLRSRAREACSWAAARSVPWLFMVTHELLDSGVDAIATLDACGLSVVMPLTGMLTAGTVAAAPGVPGLELTVPQDDLRGDPGRQLARVRNGSGGRQSGDRFPSVLEKPLSCCRRGRREAR